MVEGGARRRAFRSRLPVMVSKLQNPNVVKQRAHSIFGLAMRYLNGLATINAPRGYICEVNRSVVHYFRALLHLHGTAWHQGGSKMHFPI